MSEHRDLFGEKINDEQSTIKERREEHGRVSGGGNNDVDVFSLPIETDHRQYTLPLGA